MTAAITNAVDRSYQWFCKAGNILPRVTANLIVDGIETSLLHFLDVGAGRKKTFASADYDAADGFIVGCGAERGGEFGDQRVAQRVAFGEPVERELNHVRERRALKNQFCKIAQCCLQIASEEFTLKSISAIGFRALAETNRPSGYAR